jgi:hypothetical protein
MTTTAALVFLGTPAISLFPLDGLAAEGAQAFTTTPQPNGQAVTQCGGMSPAQNTCLAGLAEDACQTSPCWPDVHGGLAYTGSITAYVWGKDRVGQDKFVAYACSYVADSSVGVLGLVSGGCSGSSNAPYECNLNPATGRTVCGNFLWPPFKLSGVASAPVSGTAALGSWSTLVEKGD